MNCKQVGPQELTPHETHFQTFTVSDLLAIAVVHPAADASRLREEVRTDAMDRLRLETAGS